jgi:hypothetical protein
VPLKIKLHLKKLLGILTLAVTLPCFIQPSEELGIVGFTSGLDEPFKFRAYATGHMFFPSPRLLHQLLSSGDCPPYAR